MQEAYGSIVPDVNAPKAGKPERLIKTASHVCEILDSFRPETPSRTLTEISERLGLRVSSAHRLLRTLVAHRYLAVNGGKRGYRLGERIANCARTYAMSTSVASLARPLLEQLRTQTNETVTLQTRSENERTIVVQFQSAQPIRVVIDESRRYPLDAGAAGHALRAFSAEWQTFADEAKLAAIREAGYAISRGELIPGAFSLYAPIVEPGRDSVKYVVGIQAPEFRVDGRIERLVLDLRAVAVALGDIILPELPAR